MQPVREVKALPHTVHGDLYSVAADGSVLYASLAPVRDPSGSSVLREHAIELWHPITGVTQTLFVATSVSRPNAASVGAGWAVAQFVMNGRAGSDADPCPGWQLKALNLRTHTVVTIARDTVGQLPATSQGYTLWTCPHFAISGDELVWTQYARHGAKFTESLVLEHLATGQRRVLLNVPNAPTNNIDYPALHGDLLAYPLAHIPPGEGVHAESTLIIQNLSTSEVLLRVNGGWNPAISPDGTEVFYQGDTGINVVAARNGATPAEYVSHTALPAFPDSVWAPSVGEDFVAWLSSPGNWWAAERPTGKLVQLPVSPLFDQAGHHWVTGAAAGGTVLAWSVRPPPNMSNRRASTIYAAIE